MGCELEKWATARDCFIPKSELEGLPRCCEETWLGDPKGALKQYRCAHGFHVREYESWFEIHRDRVDPRRSVLGHLLADTQAPKLLVGLAALAVVRAVYG